MDASASLADIRGRLLQLHIGRLAATPKSTREISGLGGRLREWSNIGVATPFSEFHVLNVRCIPPKAPRLDLEPFPQPLDCLHVRSTTAPSTNRLIFHISLDSCGVCALHKASSGAIENEAFLIFNHSFLYNFFEVAKPWTIRKR
ncbi:MAG: hypothetical protein R6U29_08710 [Desulfosudaceae bacterium]